MDDHEAWLTDTFVELADTLTADYDLVDFLFVLIERCGELLDSPEVGLVLADSRGRLQVMASLTERMRTIELFEIQNEEGPCLDAFRTGQPVAPTPLGPEGEDRWPRFSAKARSLGYEAVLAMPMRLRGTIIGAVNVFVADERVVPERGLRLAQALTDVATIGILQERAIRRSAELAEQLEGALNTRIVIEQAKGMLAERLEIDVADAFRLLRGFARNTNSRIRIVAEDVVHGRLSGEDLRRAGGQSVSSLGAKRLR